MRCNQETQDLKVRKAISQGLFFFLRGDLDEVSPGSCALFSLRMAEKTCHKMQHTISACCKEQPLGTVFSLLFAYSHHRPSHGDSKRIEMSSHQM